MRRWLSVVVLCLLAAGCGASLPEPEQVVVTPPPGGAPKGRVMIHIAEADLNRTLSYELNRVSRQETNIKDGLALERAARVLLGREFAEVATNQPSIRPNVIAKVAGKAIWSRNDSNFKISCSLDVFDATGIPLGRYFNVYNSPAVLGLESALAPVYAQCLKGPVDAMASSQAFRDMAASGFPEPDRVLSDAFLRSQGFVTRH